MKITRNLKVPTGNILIVKTETGNLECLSLGDYGQEHNIKADFLGIKREINGVSHGEVMPLEKKWVITVSTQYGCSMGCRFCDVPKVGAGVNAEWRDISDQVFSAMSLHPEVKECKRINVHFARMGEPLMNFDNVFRAAFFLKTYFERTGWVLGYHPVVSTIVPSDISLQDNIEHLNRWMKLKNTYLLGGAGLQISVNTTDPLIRRKTMPKATLLIDLKQWAQSVEVVGRKIALNFALTDAEIDSGYLADIFPPEKFMCKITPMHMTESCVKNRIQTKDGYTEYYPYKPVEESLKDAGFDVLVFIPSVEEDDGRITCGNAILSGTLPECEYEDIEITTTEPE